MYPLINLVSCLLVLLSLLDVSKHASAVVIRHDLDDQRYRNIKHPVNGLATIYWDGGHGVLIKPKWVLTVAHATFCVKPGTLIKVDENLVEVAGVFNHPDYRPQSTHDIALIELKKPLDIDINARINRNTFETDAHFFFMGMGGTGNGLTGQTVDNYENKGVFREAENTVNWMDEMLIYSRVDEPEKGLPREGSPGNGDSGTPIYTIEKNRLNVIGLASRAEKPFEPAGKYGSIDIYTRIAPLADWIYSIIDTTIPEARFYKSETGFLPYGVERDILQQICDDINFRPQTSN